jgi:hypothetical protein
MRVKYTAKWGLQIAEMIFQTRSSQNAITEGDFLCILARNCEGTEQLHKILYISVNSADFYCYFFNSKTHKKILWL